MDADTPSDFSRGLRRSGRRWWVWLLSGLVLLLVCCAVLYPPVQTVYWVGSKDFVIQFIVNDAETGQPIDGANIFVHQEGAGYCENCKDKKDFVLTTGPDGSVAFPCGQCMSFGHDNLREHTFAIHLPSWYFYASAPAYLNGEPIDLDELPYRQQVQQGDKVATLNVAIKLRPVAR
jgi:hypothetical protein